MYYGEQRTSAKRCWINIGVAYACGFVWLASLQHNCISHILHYGHLMHNVFLVLPKSFETDSSVCSRRERYRFQHKTANLLSASS